MRHVPVLLAEVIAALTPRPGETFADCTVGLGGHALPIAKAVGPSGTVVLNDCDPANLAAAAEVVQSAGPRVIPIRGNFADLPRRMSEQGLSVDMVLADLGFASPQVEDPERGFSFQRDGPLDMRLDPSSPVSAADLVASLSERELAEIIRDLGEDRDHRRIARKLVEARATAPITTTARLAEIVRSASGRMTGRRQIDPATRTFQALRIAVNDELGTLASLLDSITRVPRGGWLRLGARVAVISFHSLEDRPVKRAFADLVSRGMAEHITRKPVEASEAEAAANPRARSARLRAIRLVG